MAKKEQYLEEFIELRIKGWSYDKIAKKLSVSKPTLIRWNTDQEVKRTIDIGKITRLESLVKKYDLHLEATIEKNAIILIKIREELNKRDFSSISTEKLLKFLSDLESKIADSIPTNEISFSHIWELEEKLNFDPTF